MMKTFSLLMAAVGSALSVACFVLLILNVAGDCDSMTNLLACIGFVVFSVAAADGWYKTIKSVLVKK